jgi:tetratricopeptide (TPR) repeat protein
MRWKNYLSSFKGLGIIGVIALVLGSLEAHQQATHQHLRPRTHPRTNPRLQTPGLHEVAGVLLQRYPEAAAPNLFMGKAMAEMGKLQEARRFLEAAMAINPRDQQLLFLYARLLVDLKEDPEQVRAVVEQMGRYFPRTRDDIEAYFEDATNGAIQFDSKSY